MILRSFPIRLALAGRDENSVTVELVKRTLAAYLLATAVAVALVLILTPVFHDGSPEYPVWRVLNWFMAVGVAAIVAVSAWRCLGSGGDADSRARLVCYGSIALAMLFYWSWFWTLNPESETGAAVTSHLVYFPAMDALYVVLALSTARRLWRAPR